MAPTRACPPVSPTTWPGCPNLDGNAPAWEARVRWRRRQGLEGEALVVDLERWAASAYLADVAPYSAQRLRRLLGERRELVWAWARGVR